MVYVRNLRKFTRPDVTALPTNDEVEENGRTGTVEIRFHHSGDPDYTMYLTPTISLTAGEWTSSYIEDTYLPELEFKVVRITSTAQLPDDIDLDNYQALKTRFDL